MNEPEEDRERPPRIRPAPDRRSDGFLRVVAALGSGLGMGMMFEPFGFAGGVWVVLLPLLVTLWSLKGTRVKRRGFALGWLSGAGFFAVCFFWLTTVTWVGWGVLVMFLALYPGLWGMFVARWANPWRSGAAREESGIERRVHGEQAARGCGRRSGPSSWRSSLFSLRIAFAVAAVWCGQEWLRSWVFTGFGWNSLGVAFHGTPVMAQSADLLGVIGLSFLPVFLQAVMAQTGRRLWDEVREGKLRPHLDFGVAAVLVALAFCYGVWRISSVATGESLRLRALLVQLNIPQEAARQLWSPEEIHLGYEGETLGAFDAIEEEDRWRFRKSDDEAMELRRPDWVIWPESSLRGRVLRAGDGTWGTWEENMETIGRVRERGNFTLILGLNEIEGEKLGDTLVEAEGARVWNSLVLLPPNDELQTFRKHHLVIFGEWIPFVDEFPFLQKIYEQQAGVAFGRSYSRGESLEPLPVEVRGTNIGMLPSVCFEDTVPRLMRKFVRDEPQVIVNVTNDGWFKESAGGEQHFANAKFRAIELRRPLVRVANQGVGAAVNVVGSTRNPETGEAQELRDESGSPFTRGWLLAEVDVPKDPVTTLYAMIGDWGVIGLALAGVACGVIGGRRNAS